MLDRLGLRDDSGVALATVVFVSVIVFILLSTMLVLMNYRSVQSTHYSSRSKALELADAGLNFYLYKLSLDYTYYATVPTPTPTLTNADGSWAASASYSPTTQLVTIRSVGTLTNGTKRSVIAKCSPPPPPMYAVGSGGNIDVGANTTINGPMRSNGYVHITTGGSAGIITGLAQSGVSPGGDFSPTSGGKPDPTRFKGGASYYPALSFDLMTTGITNMASAAGISLPSSRSDGKTPSALGYLITISGNYVGVRRVMTYQTAANSTATINSLGAITTSVPPSVTTTYAIPGTGVIYVAADNVYVQGTYTARVTIVATRASSSDTTYGNIIVVNSVKCGDTNNPTTVCGLIGQNNVYLPDWTSRSLMDATLTVQAALLAQFGGVNDSNMPSGLSNKGGTQSTYSYKGVYAYYPYHDLYLAGSVLGKTGIGFDSTYFVNRYYGFDPRLSTNPPPYWPHGDNQWILVSSYLEN
jgi:hypothetical protein